MSAFLLRLDDIESVNVLKNYKYTLAIWKWTDRFLVFNLDYVTVKKEMKHLLVSMGGYSFVWLAFGWSSAFKPFTSSAPISNSLNFN